MNEDNLQKVLESIYDEIEDALRRKDFDAVESYMAPEFVGQPGEEGPKDRDAVMTGLRAMLAAQDVISWQRRITNLVVDGGTVTAMAEGTFKTSLGEMFLKNEDIWERRGERWVMVRSRTIDG